MIEKPHLDNLRERATAAHHTMRQVCHAAGVQPNTWYRAYVRGNMAPVQFRKLTDAMDRIEAARGLAA